MGRSCLGDDGHGGAQLLEAYLGNVDAVNHDRPAGQLLQPVWHGVQFETVNSSSTLGKAQM